MKFRWTDERKYAYEFDADSGDSEIFENALNTFRLLEIAAPHIRKPFSAHLHFFHERYGWGQLKPAIALGERQNINDWTTVYSNALRVHEYANEFYEFCHHTVADMVTDGEINELRKKYQAGEF